jgi:hypothetical protein
MFWCLAAKGDRRFPLVGVVVLALSFCLALGYSVYPMIEDEALVSMRITYSRTAYDAAFLVIFSAICSLFFGGLVVLRKPQRASFYDSKVRLDKLVGDHAGMILLFGIVPLVLYFIGYTPEGLISRRHYLAMGGPQLAVSASSIFGPVGVVLTSIVLVVRQSHPFIRAAAGFLLCAYFVTMIATGSRAVAVIPLVLLWLYFEFRTPSRVRGLVALVAGAAALAFLLNASLVFRLKAAGAGLLPYMQVVSDAPALFFELKFGQLIGNVLFGVPLTGDIVLNAQLDSRYFWTSVNPLPGSLTDWSAILGELSWGPATPYNTFGELFAYGFGFLVAFMFGAGVLISLLDNVIHSFGGAMRQTLLLVAMISLLLFASAVFQYPVRNASRIVWYLAFVVSVLALLRAHTQSLRKSNATIPGSLARHDLLS